MGEQKKKLPQRERHALRYPASMKQPKEWLRFIQLDPFAHCWEKLGLTDKDMQALEILIMSDPGGVPVIKGTGGVRKLRFAGSHWNSGKRSGARVYYLYVPSKGVVFLIFVHVKNEQDSITAQQKSQMSGLVSEILQMFEEGC